MESAAAAEWPTTHHRDPFDRMVVAQAAIEEVPLLTADRQMEPYEVALVWVG